MKVLKVNQRNKSILRRNILKRKFSKILGIGLTLALLISMLVVAAPVQATATAVTDVYVDFLFADTQNIANDSGGGNEYLVHFKPTTALVRGVDFVTVSFPDGIGTTMGPAAFTMGAVAATDATFSTNFGTSFSATWQAASSAATINGYRVKVKTPINVAAGADVWLAIDSTAIKAPNNVSNAWKVYVQTTKDTTRVISSAFSLDTSAITDVNDALVVTPDTAGVAAEYKLVFRVTNAGATTVTARLPVGVGMPSSMDVTEVLFSLDGSSWFNASATPVIDVDRRTVTAATSLTLATGADNYMKIIQGAGVTNPTSDTETYRAMMKTNDDATWAWLDASTAIVAGTATKLAFTSTADDATIVNAFTLVLELESQDQYGNKKAAATTTEVAVSTSGSGVVHSVAGGSGNLWGASQTHSSGTDDVFYRPTAAGTHTLTASVVSGDSLTSATIDVSVVPAVTLKDSDGNTLATFKPASSVYTAGLDSGDYIQNAINAAHDGDTVELGDGIYELDDVITLDEKITLTSTNGRDYTTIRPIAEEDKAIDVTVSGDSTNPITISGITFTRLKSGTEFDMAIRNNGKNYVWILDNAFTYIIPDASGTSEAVIWTQIGGATITSLKVNNNTFTNCVTFNGLSNGSARSGVIQFYDSGGSTASTGVTVSGNTITDSYDYGIVIGAGTSAHTVTITNNTITNGYSALVLADGMLSATVTGNTITTPYNYGISVEGNGNTAVTIKNNTITGSANEGIKMSESTAAAITIQYNSITGSNDEAIKNTGGLMDAKYNWYGSASGPGATVSGTSYLTTTPWLHKSLADVVADNASYPTLSESLAVGWNTLSVPGKLISTADALDEMIPTGMTIAYKYASGWVQVTTEVINPLDGLYVKMASAQTVLLKVDGAAFSTPTKSLAAGWNLVGLASLTTKTPTQATASIPSTSFGQMVSPSMNTTEWVFTTGGSDNMAIGEGYWIFMKSAATIAGFTILPMAPSLN